MAWKAMKTADEHHGAADAPGGGRRWAKRGRDAVGWLLVGRGRKPYLVIWDDECSFCRSWIVWFRRLDWLGVLRFEGSGNCSVLAEVGITPEEASQEIKLMAGGKVYGGFEAVRRVLAVLPVSLIWEPILRLPPIRSLGNRAYRAVAARRMCPLPRP